MSPENIIIPSPPVQPAAAPAAVTPGSVGIKIDDVNKSLWHYILRRKLWELALFVPLAVAWGTLIIWAIFWSSNSPGYSDGNSSSGGGNFIYAILAPLFLFSAWLQKLRKQFEDAFLEEFALANNFKFDKNGLVDGAYCTLFNFQGDLRVSDVVSGTYAGSPLRMFLYQLTVGSGRYQQRYKDTVVELDLNGRLPEIIMVNKHSKFGGQLDIAGQAGLTNTVQLEGDFNRHFSLYAPKGMELETLEIFTPDIMLLMEEKSRHYTVEFAGSRVYIYANGYISNARDLIGIFDLARQLINKIAPLATRFAMDADFTAPPAYTANSRSASRGRKTILTIILWIGLVVGIIATFIAAETQNPSSQSATAGPSANDQTQNFGSYVSLAKQLDSQSTSQHDLGSQILTAGQKALAAANSGQQKSAAEYWISDGYFWQKQYQAVITHEQLAISYYPQEPSNYVMEGNAMVDLGQFLQALQAAGQAIKYNPKLPGAYRVKAVALADLKQKSQAIAAINQAVAIDSAPGAQANELAADQQLLQLISARTPPIYLQP